jgi:hypothetical protein
MKLDSNQINYDTNVLPTNGYLPAGFPARNNNVSTYIINSNVHINKRLIHHD